MDSGKSMDESGCQTPANGTAGGRLSSLHPALASLRDAAIPKPVGNVASSSNDGAVAPNPPYKPTQE